MKHHLARLLRGLADRIDPPIRNIDFSGMRLTVDPDTSASGSNYRLTFLK